MPKVGSQIGSNGRSLLRTLGILRRRPSVEAQEYAVGWGSLALINAGLAQGKNRSGLGWFLLSLLLGPIATFILVAFMDKVPPRS